jgi:hypothetical protein
MLAIVAGVFFVLVIGMTALAGKKASKVEDMIYGMEPVSMTAIVERKTTPAALVPSVLFVVMVMILTVFGIMALNLVPMR